MKMIVLLTFLTVIISAVPRSEAADIHWCPGLIGLSRQQTMRINVNNFGEATTFVIAIIHDADGNVVKEFPSQMLEPKKTLSLDFSNGDLGPVDLRVVVDFINPHERRAKKLIKTARASIEIVDDASGKTEAFYAPGDGIGFEPI